MSEKRYTLAEALSHAELTRRIEEIEAYLLKDGPVRQGQAIMNACVLKCEVALNSIIELINKDVRDALQQLKDERDALGVIDEETKKTTRKTSRK